MYQSQESTQNDTSANVILLKLPHVAAWQIDYPPAAARTDCMAELPALQRGAVWKVDQIEALWDSILQGFPLGAFLLSPFDDSLGQQNFKHETHAAPTSKPTHMLLDGQQRANGIALAFLNPWHNTSPAADAKSVLWVDLAPPPKGRDVEFAFRAVTRAHPWGYSLTNPSERVSQHQIRQSLYAFRAASAPQYDKSKPHEMPLHAVWPWDAKAPVPVCLLMQALHEKQGKIDEAKAHVWQVIQQLAFMKPIGDAHKDALNEWAAQQTAVRQAFEGAESRLDVILVALRERLSAYVIPANVVPRSALQKTIDPTGDSVQQSPVETLFIRVNSAGTPLGGEELMYSLIKSAWIEAPGAIAKLTHKLATPARTALLASRLVRARHQRWAQSNGNHDSRLRLIATPSVEDFRRLMHGQNKEYPDFPHDLKNYICGNGLQVFEAAHQFLTQGKYGLPPVLASEMAQKSPDVFFLFLSWLDRLMFEGAVAVQEVVAGDSPKVRRVIGFLTALAWFAKADNKPRAVDAIWHSVQTMDAGNLSDFFNREMFLKTMAIDERGRQHMIPVLDPDVLKLALQKHILGYQGCTGTISQADSTIWSQWNWWRSLISEDRPKDIDRALKPFFHETTLTDGETVSDRVRDTWNQFIDALWGNKSMLLYVQRKWINHWFSDFDPSLPELLEDKNRPWDFDHIHPQSFLQGRNGGTLRGLPAIITDWHNSIGNLRAWPLEANRSDSDAAPTVKLKTASSVEGNYGITNANKCEASFIDTDEYDKYWSLCNPADGKKLNDAATFAARQALVNAMVLRFLAIYRKWYDDLKLSTLS